MRPLLLASVSVAALFFASQASAADLAVKARPMMVPAPVYSWTGCYVGAHVGWGWGHNRQNQSIAFTGGTGGLFTGGSSSKIDSSGGLFGGQVGCNYQFDSNWVVGAQGDIAGAHINGRADDPGVPFLKRILGGEPTIGINSDWLASATVRLGYTGFDNRALFYVKGGGAWIHNIWDLHSTDVFYNPTQVGETRGGWTVGAGIEYAFMQNWSAFVEGNYYDFGHGKLLASNFDLGVITFSSGKQTVETVKIGVNYKFGGDAPVVARY